MARANQTKVTRTEAPVQEPNVDMEQPLRAPESGLAPITVEMVEKLREELKSKSAVMRRLSKDGYTRSQIAKALGVKYQFVRNVLIAAAEKSAQ